MFGKIGESIEILWIEVQSTNKNTPDLIGVVYQPSSNETEKLIWFEKIERTLTKICIKWSRVIIIAGDFNIDIEQSQRRYKDILHSFSLLQHITEATRKSKTLINHVISTTPNDVIHHDILHTEEISDNDAPQNFRKSRHAPCFCNMFDEGHYVMSLPYYVIFRIKQIFETKKRENSVFFKRENRLKLFGMLE